MNLGENRRTELAVGYSFGYTSKQGFERSGSTSSADRQCRLIDTACTGRSVMLALSISPHSLHVTRICGNSTRQCANDTVHWNFPS